ncbi:MAG: replication initiation protein [Ruminococcus sp.]|nr:replication initiation protein [Ruminococcus sp.]
MKELYPSIEVSKSNILNEVIPKMPKLEFALLHCYLALIDPKDTNSKFVRIDLKNFAEVVNYDFKNCAKLVEAAELLFAEKVEEPNPYNEKGKGREMIHLFHTVKTFNEGSPEGYIILEAEERALPYMFNYTKEFFHFPLQQAISLSSENQRALYLYLHENKFRRSFDVEIEKLKERMGAESQNTKYFKRDVLNLCIQAINEKTDLKVTLNRGRTGEKGKLLSVIFDITSEPPKEKSNQSGKQLELKDGEEVDTELHILIDEITEHRFSDIETQNIAILVGRFDILPDPAYEGDDAMLKGKIDFIKQCYATFKRQETLNKSKNQAIKHPYKYFSKIIKNEEQKEKERSLKIKNSEENARALAELENAELQSKLEEKRQKEERLEQLKKRFPDLF